jgi:hypothetical protein
MTSFQYDNWTHRQRETFAPRIQAGQAILELRSRSRDKRKRPLGRINERFLPARGPRSGLSPAGRNPILTVTVDGVTESQSNQIHGLYTNIVN